MNQSFLKKCTGFLIIFIVTTGILFFLKDLLQGKDVDVNFIMGANALFFVLTVFGFAIQLRGSHATNINAFLRGIYSSLLVKMFAVVIALVIYIGIAGGAVNTAAVMTSMGLYFLYAGVEVAQLMKIVRKKPNA